MFHKLKKEKFYILEGIVICMLLLPGFITSFYSLPAMDDFSASGTFISFKTGTLMGMMKYLRNFYLQWGGCYFSVFIEFFVAPFARDGVEALQWANFLGILFFYVSLLILIMYLFQTFCEWHYKKHAAIITFILLTYLLVSNDSMPSMLTWWCVVSVYVIVVACMFLGIIFYFKALQENRAGYIILAAVLGFLASGSALNVAALNCGIYFILAVLGVCIWKKRKYSIFMTACAWFGGIVNVLAPGNYVRRNTYSEELHIVYALKLSIGRLWVRGQQLLFETPFIVVLIILLLIGLLCIPRDCKFKFRFPWLVVFFFLMAVVIVNYPVFLGYGDVMGWFPEHCIWVMDLTLYLGSFISIFYVAGWIKVRDLQPRLSKNMIWAVIVCVVLYFCNLGAFHKPDESATIRMIKNIMGGTYAVYVDYWESILKEIEMSDDECVIVVRNSEPDNGGMIKSPDIREDSSHWVNKSVAQFYGKESVSLQITSAE